MRLPRTNTPWGALTLLDIRDERVRIPRRAGFDMVTVTVLDLECECGKRWTMNASEFEGKRKRRDCGCGLAAIRHVNISAYIQHPTASALKREAKDLDISMSKLVKNILDQHVANARTLAASNETKPITAPITASAGAAGQTGGVDPT